METKITCDWIDRFNDGDLDEKEMELFRKHLSENPLLRSEVNIDAKLNRFLHDEGVLDLMGKVRSVYKSREGNHRKLYPLLVAASFLFLAAVGGWFVLVLRTPANLAVTVPAREIAPKITDEPIQVSAHRPGIRRMIENTSLPVYQSSPILLACAYEPLMELELLVGTVTRSRLLVLNSPEPLVNVTSGARVLFSWESCNELPPVCVVIVNNRGSIVKEEQVQCASGFVLKTDEYKPGLYYWKIIVEGDLLFTGKLTIL
jgi:hypothetical protein